MEILSNEKAATLGLAEISLSVLSGLISPFDGFGDFGEVIIREGVVYSSRFSIVETNAW